MKISLKVMHLNIVEFHLVCACALKVFKTFSSYSLTFDQKETIFTTYYLLKILLRAQALVKIVQL